MKKILLILFLTLGINTISAECIMCASSGMQFFPQQKEISLSSMFIIQGYSFSQKTIDNFEDRKIYLESKNGELIELKLQEILKGQMRLTQAIFKPIKQLKPNTTYFLKYSDQTEKETGEMMEWNPKKKEREQVYWRTTTKKTIELLNSNLKIEFDKTNVAHFGCGPAVSASFIIKNNSNPEVWYKTEVTEISTNKKVIFYIKQWNKNLVVGHGMCSGAFTFAKKGKYKVRFTPMNIDGKSLKTTSWKIFESPFMNDKSLSGFGK